jgi:hypothetical protein
MRLLRGWYNKNPRHLDRCLGIAQAAEVGLPVVHFESVRPLAPVRPAGHERSRTSRQHSKQTSGDSPTVLWWSRMSGKTMAGSRPQFGHFKEKPVPKPAPTRCADCHPVERGANLFTFVTFGFGLTSGYKGAAVADVRDQIIGPSNSRGSPTPGASCKGCGRPRRREAIAGRRLSGPRANPTRSGTTAKLSGRPSNRRGRVNSLFGLSGAALFHDSLVIGSLMDFHLRYRGPLKANGGPVEKAQIRKYLHPQLEELWRTAPQLREISLPSLRIASVINNENPILQAAPAGTSFSPSVSASQKPQKENYYYRFPLENYSFIPLVTRLNGLNCEVEITFLRRQDAGAIVNIGGDIDNRLKTLLDALRIPCDKQELGLHPSPDPTNVFCLLEDDVLITRIAVLTGRLLGPLHDQSAPSLETDVELHIHVTVKVNVATPANLEY